MSEKQNDQETFTQDSKVKLSSLEPRPGDILCREWWTQEHNVHIRHVLVVAALRPHPYVAAPFRGRRSNSPAVTRYMKWQKTTREQLQIALSSSGIKPFDKDWNIGVAISSAARPAPLPDAKTTLSGHIDKRQVKNITDWDSTNMHKAIEDSMKAILWNDDKQVRTIGPGAHFSQTGDAFAIHAWGSPNNYIGWNSDWDNNSVPFTYRWLSTV